MSKRLTFQDTNTSEQLSIFTRNETIEGEVNLTMVDINKFEHLGITLSLIGEIYNVHERTSTEFISLSKDLERQGSISKPMKYSFSFKEFEGSYESYQGTHFSINYCLRLVIIRKMLKVKETFEKNFIVQNPICPPVMNGNCRMEIGVMEKLHLEYELFKTKYHLSDIITGKMYFVDVLIPIQSIEIQLIKKERIGVGEHEMYENIIIGRMEICDGQPFEGDIIPFRMYLNGKDVAPTIKNANFLSLTYYMKFVVLLENDKVFYKNQEIILWRKEFC